MIGPFDYSVIKRDTRFPIICIYSHPSDYPDKFVARLFDIDSPTDVYEIADTLDEIRQTIPPEMVRMERDPNDDPCIVEVFM